MLDGRKRKPVLKPYSNYSSEVERTMLIYHLSGEPVYTKYTL